MTRTYLFIIFFLTSFSASGASCPEQDEQDKTIQETIEVQARLPRENLPSKSVLIINSEEIAALRVNSLAELLAALPGLQAMSRGPADSSFDLVMTGANFEQVLLLVDGVPFSNPQTGHHNTSLPFSPAEIERIEIIRGGGASMYGSGAFAGVVQIVLKKSATNAFALQRGEHDLFSGTLRIGGSAPKADWLIAGERFHTRGFYQGRELSQFKINGSLSLKKRYFSLSGRAAYLVKNFGAGGFYSPLPSKESIDSGFLHISGRSGKLQISLARQFLRDDFTLDRNRPDYFFNRSESDVSHFFISGNSMVGEISLTGGIDLRREKLTSSTMGRHQRLQGAFFYSASLMLDQRLGLDLGGRLQLCAGRQPGLAFYTGLHRRLGERFFWRLGAGRTMRLPSFTELYYNSPANRGDPGLHTETALNLDSSLAFAGGPGSLELSFFYRRYYDLIDWISFSAGNSWQAVNLPGQIMSGMQADFRIVLEPGMLFFSLEKILASSRNTGFLSKYGLRFADTSLKCHVNRHFGPINLALRFNRRRLLGRRSWDNLLHAALSFSRGTLVITFHADNLFNSRVEELPGLPTSGRWFSFSISSAIGSTGKSKTIN